MKSLIKAFALFLVWSSGVWITPNEASAQQGSVSFQVFYDELSPYGMWVSYPNYGYVWIPDGDPGFSPYATSGYWVFTDDGWTWVSDYPWGWAPFHYGRWDYDNTYGWFWVPDGEWGPAWVSWRRSPGYYGWAPLRPGISMSIALGRDYHERNERWIFVRDRDITGREMGHHYVDRANNATIINNSTLIVNTRRDNNRNATYIAGPDRADVQKFTHTTVKSVAIREADKPGHRLNNDELQIYRPQVQKGNVNGQAPAPPKVIKLNDVKPLSERNAGNRQQRPPSVDPQGKDLPQPRGVTPADKGQPSRPRNANPSDKGKPKQPANVNPSDTKGRQQQPPVVNPPDRGQPSQPRNANPSDKGRQRESPAVNPPDRGQSPQPRDVSPSDTKGRQQQPSVVNPPDKGQPSQPRGANPSNKGRERQPRTVHPPGKAQASPSRAVSPSNSGTKGKPPQNVAPPNKNRKAQPSQPNPNQDEKDKTKREPGK